MPYGATATGNIMVTAGLAIIAFFMIQISAIKAQGFKHYFAHEGWSALVSLAHYDSD